MVKYIFLLCFIPFSLGAQSNIDKAINYLQQFSTEEQNFELIAQQLAHFEKSPINLNDFSLEETLSFPLLNEPHWSALRKYSRINGNILSFNELPNLPYFTEELTQIIKPFCVLKPVSQKERIHGYFMQKFNKQLEPSKGFQSNDSASYLGSNAQKTTRLMLQNKSYNGFITWKKDKGEQINFSHIKGGLTIKNKGAFNTINLGSFSVHMGEGLIHSNNFISPKNLPSSAFFKLNQNIKKNGTTSNSNFENGAAFELKYKRLTSIFFYSKRNIHGTLENDTLKSIKLDDLFRTNNDLSKVNSSNSKSYGSSQQINFQYLSVCFNSKLFFQDHFYQPTINYYNTNYGHQNLWNNSISFRYFNGNFIAKGETAVDKELNQSSSYFFGGRIDELNLLLNLRTFDANYNAISTNTFSESSRVQNEQALFISSEYNQNRIFLFGSIDLFGFTNPKYQTHSPSHGKESILFGQLKLTKASTFKVFFKSEIKQKDNATFSIDRLESHHTKRAYGQLKIDLGNNNFVKVRMDQNLYQSKSKTSIGYSGYIQYAANFPKQTINARLTSFNTQDWDSRIYLYENDVLYHFSVPVLYGSGFRFYLNYKRIIGKRITLWMKLGQFYYPNQSSIGSGKDEITGNTKTEFRIQARIKI